VTWDFITPGIPDHMFERAEGVPMTKAEVRAVALSKLRLKKGGVLVDVGCGTGTVSIEAALLMGPGSVVYAIDKNPQAVELTMKNAHRFGVADRVKASVGKAPEALERLPPADRYFIGGGGAELGEIIKSVVERVKGGVVVIDVVTLESLSTAVSALRGVEFEVALVQVARGRRVGGFTIMEGLNPVYIITAYV
jgi:cobalt-precorrin-6B (C15)-methyltransferase